MTVIASEIDGVVVSDRDQAFALSVSDILYGDLLDERLDAIGTLTGSHSHLRFVCVRNDTMDAGMFSSVASRAAELGLGMILESSDPVCLRAAVEALDGRRPLLCITDRDRLGETALLSAVSGCPLGVPAPDTETLMESVELAEGYGAEGIVLCPGYQNMKGCLETCTDLHRLAAEHSFPQACHPVMTRTWSGEYALAVSSVSVMKQGALVVLDDLDAGCCDVLDALMESLVDDF